MQQRPLSPRGSAVWLCTLLAIGCHAHGTESKTALARGALPGTRLAGIDGSRWLWVEAECSDGALELGSVGLDRELILRARQHGDIGLIFETELATEGCFSSAEWSARPGSRGELWHFVPQTLVTLPPDAACGPDEREASFGSLRVYGDVLEMVTRGSAWCRGFDARFVYRRAEPGRLTQRQLVTRYAGAFNRRDPDALAELFVNAGSLVEPFTRTDDGNYKRHEGRAAIRAWYASAFASTAWSALRVTSIAAGAGADQLIVEWEYMDAQLAEPLHGRNLFLMAGGEIYETELQLVDDPKSLRGAVTRSAAALTSTPAPSTSTVAR